MRADRLISLILLLNARGRMTASELSSQLEVSERTIYRDLDALSAAGIPVYTQPGASGGVFLDEHYRVSLTGLSAPEVRSLFISSDVGPLRDLGLEKAVEHTLLKLLAALPSNTRSEAERMRQRFHIDPENWFQNTDLSPFLPPLQQAVWEDRVITVEYRPVEAGWSARTLDAYALVAKANIWYLVGRKPDGAMRNYRVSRFRKVTLTEQCFDRDTAFDLAAYWHASREQFEHIADSSPYRAVLRVRSDMLWYFPAYMQGRFEEIGADDGSGWATIRASFDSLFDGRMRVLGLGTAVVVIEPDELRLAVLDAARQIAAANLT